MIAFRSPKPGELAALAGTERVAKAPGGSTASTPSRGGVTVTMRARVRVDQDAVRQLPAGEADLIVRAVAERIRIIRTRIPGSVETVARPPGAGEEHPPVDRELLWSGSH